ncbi:hypothetical protein IVB22_33710 [Bradyrhizobium sp. 190]|uniref:hypothetical protein n=1 Tax=Bradyrhizobium sp. 190 TaxID=2782658 RepID=UPI001FF75570|nr:hypothetical protein [Bradyrhizobium sp. 190]MCK1517376.1 hypothetical protein [Bradyrhizobium sp. 190]
MATTDRKLELTNQHPMSIVFRFPAVSLSREVFEATLSMPVDRFEPSKDGPLSYAQIDVPEDGDAWASAATIAERLGPATTASVERGEMGQPWADIAVSFLDDRMTTSLFIPSTFALVLGRWGFQIEVSVYLTSPD